MTLIRKSFKVPEGAILPNVSSFDLTSVKPSGLCYFMQLYKLEIINGDFSRTIYDDKKLKKELHKLCKEIDTKIIYYYIEVNDVLHNCILFNLPHIKICFIADNDVFTGTSIATFMHDLYFDALIHFNID